MKSRGVVLDLDGTIVNKFNKISEPVLTQLTEMIKKDIPIIIATGRSLLRCNGFLQKIKPNWPVICFDGRLVYDFCKKKNIVC